jgi:hypothetical protein
LLLGHFEETPGLADVPEQERVEGGESWVGINHA